MWTSAAHCGSGGHSPRRPLTFHRAPLTIETPACHVSLEVLMTLRNLATLPAVALAAGSLWLTGSAQQTTGGAASRVLLSETAAPAIDRGVRDNDPPRDPADAASHTHHGRFLRGSVIVRFRDGTSATARASMVGRINGTRTQALSYADFEIVNIDPGADPEAAARDLAAQPDVDYAQARYVMHSLFVPNDPL